MSEECDCIPTHYGPQGAASLAVNYIHSQLIFQTSTDVGETFDPTITLGAGCPWTPLWDFGDGTTDTGLAPTKNDYADAGPHTITLTIPDISRWLTSIDVNADNIEGDFLTAIQDCTALTSIIAHENSNLTGDIAILANFPDLATIRLGDHTAVTGDIAALATLTNLTWIRISGTEIHGDLADIATMTQLTYLDLHTNTANGGITGEFNDLDPLTGLTALAIGNTFVTGALADLFPRVPLNILYAYGATVTVTGSLNAINGTNLTQIRLYDTAVTVGDVDGITNLIELQVHNLGWNQAAVDALLLNMYTNRMGFTSPSGVRILNISGTNAAPSGIYQNAAPPTTGLEYVFKLANDPDAEGFTTWTITYTGGVAP